MSEKSEFFFAVLDMILHENVPEDRVLLEALRSYARVFHPDVEPTPPQEVTVWSDNDLMERFQAVKEERDELLAECGFLKSDLKRERDMVSELDRDLEEALDLLEAREEENLRLRERIDNNYAKAIDAQTDQSQVEKQLGVTIEERNRLQRKVERLEAELEEARDGDGDWPGEDYSGASVRAGHVSQIKQELDELRRENERLTDSLEVRRLMGKHDKHDRAAYKESEYPKQALAIRSRQVALLTIALRNIRSAAPTISDRAALIDVVDREIGKLQEKVAIDI